MLGVTGGIAAYKSPDLVRRLRESGAEVQVVVEAGGALLAIAAIYLGNARLPANAASTSA